MDRSPYHIGFSTLDRETTLDDLAVRGTVPPWLSGTLVRTAPAKFEVGDRGYNHWFDGLAMLHKFASEVVAYTETRMPIRFDPDTLNTLGGYGYDERIKGPISTAHPHLDHARGRHYTYVLEFGWRSNYPK